MSRPFLNIHATRSFKCSYSSSSIRSEPQLQHSKSLHGVTRKTLHFRSGLACEHRQFNCANQLLLIVCVYPARSFRVSLAQKTVQRGGAPLRYLPQTCAKLFIPRRCRGEPVHQGPQVKTGAAHHNR